MFFNPRRLALIALLSLAVVSTLQGQVCSNTSASTMSIKPMSQLNARYYAYRYSEDSDYYNENYKKKYGQTYGDFIYDSEFDFVKDTASTQIIFAPSVLYQPTGHGHSDKY